MPPGAFWHLEVFITGIEYAPLLPQWGKLASIAAVGRVSMRPVGGKAAGIPLDVLSLSAAFVFRRYPFGIIASPSVRNSYLACPGRRLGAVPGGRWRVAINVWWPLQPEPGSWKCVECQRRTSDPVTRFRFHFLGIAWVQGADNKRILIELYRNRFCTEG